MPQTPLIRAGRVGEPDVEDRVVARFRNAAQGNAVIQLLLTLGVKADQLGVTGPDRMPGGQGMILSIACGSDSVLRERVEAACRSQGAELFGAESS
jgi:hypothetical protein